MARCLTRLLDYGLPIGDSCIQGTERRLRLDGLELQIAHMHSTSSRRLKRSWFTKHRGPIEPETAPSLGAQALQAQLQLQMQTQLQTRHALAKSCILCIGTT